MAGNISTFAKALLLKLPLLLKTAILSGLSMSPAASKQETLTELTIIMIREFLRQPTSVGKSQMSGTTDPGVKGAMWIAKVTIPAPEDVEGLSPKDAVELAIQDLGDGFQSFSAAYVGEIEAEWTGYRSGVDADVPQPELSEAKRYEHMMTDVKSDVTVLYIHGGGHFVMDPITHRSLVSGLAERSGGRFLSVRYRLAPQNPFPAALIDILVSYLYLVSPPSTALHQAVPPSKIVFAGDSAGGNLALALLLTIMTLRKRGIHSIRFYGVDVPLEVPAGVALSSPWCDLSCSLPSYRRNASYDYMAMSPNLGFADKMLPDEIWPRTPPRLELYMNASALAHPLVTPLAAPLELWEGAPPTYICVGNELMEDEDLILARKMHTAGVKVRLDAYEGMPHCFMMVFLTHPFTKTCMDSWSGFIKSAVDDSSNKQSTEGFTWARAFSKPVERVPHSWTVLDELPSDKKVQELVQKKREWYVEKEEKVIREWSEKEKKKARL